MADLSFEQNGTQWTLQLCELKMINEMQNILTHNQICLFAGLTKNLYSRVFWRAYLALLDLIQENRNTSHTWAVKNSVLCSERLTDVTTHPPPALHFKCFEWHTFRRLSNACHFRQQRQNVFIVSWNTPESWSNNRHNLHTASWIHLLTLNRKLNYGTFYNRDDSPTLLDWHICRLYVLTFYGEIMNSTCPCMQILLPHAKVFWVVARALQCGC